MDTCCLGLQSLLAVSLYSTCPIFALPSRNIHSFMVFRRKLVWNKSEFQMELLFKASNTNKCLFPNHWRQGTIYVVSVKIFEKMLRTSLNNNSGVLIKTNCFCDDKAKSVGDETRRGRDKNVFLLQRYFIQKQKGWERGRDPSIKVDLILVVLFLLVIWSDLISDQQFSSVILFRWTWSWWCSSSPWSSGRRGPPSSPTASTGSSSTRSTSALLLSQLLVRFWHSYIIREFWLNPALWSCQCPWL